MKKLILSVIESLIAGIISWKIALPTFNSLASTEVGNWAYLGLITFLVVVILVEYKSYKENNLTWLLSLIIGSKLD